MRASILFIAYLALFHLWAICFGGLFFPFDCFLLMFLIHTSLNIDGCLLFNCVCVCMCTLSHFSRIQLFATLWTAAHQASLSIRFSRQEYWSGFPCPPLEDLPQTHISCIAGGFFTHWPTWEALIHPCSYPNTIKVAILFLVLHSFQSTLLSLTSYQELLKSHITSILQIILYFTDHLSENYLMRLIS